MTESAIVLPPLGTEEYILLWSVLGSALIALLYGVILILRVLRRDRGTKKMIEVAAAIEEGAMAYLKRQAGLMIWFVLAVTVGLFFMYRQLYAGISSHGIPLHLGVAFAFLMGAAASYGAGFVGMWLAVKGNVRTAAAALKSFGGALELAFNAGTVSGMFTVGFGLAGATIIFLVFQEHAMKVLVGFGFGGSLAALFMRVGGGIYTKAADVGADLVGKVEAGIPEDDPRNPATIADNVGDNVGDCAGMAADIFESYEVTLVAAIILAVGALLDPGFTKLYGAYASAMALKMVIYPLLLRAVGVFSSIIGTMCVRARTSALKDPMWPIQTGYWVSGIVSVIGFAVVTYFYLIDPTTGTVDWRFFWATSMGIVLAIVTLAITKHFTHPDKAPATETALATKTGAATAILSGLGIGLESSTWAIISIAGTIAASVLIFGGNVALASYGVALAGLGLLTTTGFILAMDTYGPITDNAHGIFEMSGYTETKLGEAGRNLSWLDAIGNTTKALTKGLAIATAVIAAIALFKSYNAEAMLEKVGIQINLPMVFVGLLIGGAVPFLFSSFALEAVERAAFLIVEEVRRQFREHPGIMGWKEKPDYRYCVDIVTRQAQKELLGPGILAIATPILVAFAFGAQALGGYLAGTILTGQLMAVFMSNAGAVWDNAKKKIEDGFLGGKGSDEHKASVICDTVGDPFKDTAGPALNPLIKVMNLVAILIAPFAIRDLSWTVKGIIVGICLAALIVAVVFSKRGGVEEMERSYPNK